MAKNKPGKEQHLPRGEVKEIVADDWPGQRGLIGSDLVRQPQQPRCGQHACREAMLEQHERYNCRGQHQDVEKRDVDQVIRTVKRDHAENKTPGVVQVPAQRPGQLQELRDRHEDQRQAYGEQIQLAGAFEQAPQAGAHAVTLDDAGVRAPSHQARHEDETLRGRRIEPVTTRQ